MVGWLRLFLLAALVVLMLGGCTRGLAPITKARLDTVGIAPARFVPQLEVDTLPATRSAVVRDDALYYSGQWGGYSFVPLAALMTPGPYLLYELWPAYVASIALGVVGSGAGAAYGGIHGLLQPVPAADRAQEAYESLSGCIADNAFQTQLAAVFAETAAAETTHRFLLLDAIGPLPAAPSPPYSIFTVRRAPPPQRWQSPAYHQLVPPEVHSVLELTVERVALGGTASATRLRLSGAARLLMPRRNSASPLFQEVRVELLDFFSDTHPYEAWNAGEGTLLRESLHQAYRSWALQLVDRWFR